LPDAEIIKIVKRRLKMSDCLNKGYILDGILKTYAQIEAVFLN
jgi:adenylate kinase family enzyme